MINQGWTHAVTTYLPHAKSAGFMNQPVRITEVNQTTQPS